MSALVRTLCISLFWNGIYDMILCRDPHRIVVHKRELTFELLKSTGYCSLIKTTSDFFGYVEWAPRCSAGQTGCTDWVCLHCLEFVLFAAIIVGCWDGLSRCVEHAVTVDTNCNGHLWKTVYAAAAWKILTEALSEGCQVQECASWAHKFHPDKCRDKGLDNHVGPDNMNVSCMTIKKYISYQSMLCVACSVHQKEVTRIFCLSSLAQPEQLNRQQALVLEHLCSHGSWKKHNNISCACLPGDVLMNSSCLGNQHSLDETDHWNCVYLFASTWKWSVTFPVYPRDPFLSLCVTLMTGVSLDV